MLKNFKNLRNELDFFLRSHIRFGKEVQNEDAQVKLRDQNFQKESEKFFDLFPWKRLLSRFPQNQILKVADIGARNFALAPIIEKRFLKFHYEAKVDGIEMDAYRRLSNFRTRKNYGDYYAKQIQRGQFHALDFLNWQDPLEVAFLLNPFVTESPVLAWGLPLSTLKPRQFFSHHYSLLKKQKGFALISSPSEEEIELVVKHSKNSGFSCKYSTLWEPKDEDLQTQSRYGIIADTE